MTEIEFGAAAAAAGAVPTAAATIKVRELLLRVISGTVVLPGFCCCSCSSHCNTWVVWCSSCSVCVKCSAELLQMRNMETPAAMTAAAQRTVTACCTACLHSTTKKASASNAEAISALVKAFLEQSTGCRAAWLRFPAMQVAEQLAFRSSGISQDMPALEERHVAIKKLQKTLQCMLPAGAQSRLHSCGN